MSGEAIELPEWSSVAVSLLRGTVYGTDARTWSRLLDHRSAVEDYVAKVGLKLVIDETSPGIAYLRQLHEDEVDTPGDPPPTLLRQQRLTYPQTLLSVLLRDEYRRFEDGTTPDERCVVEERVLFEQWQAFFPESADERRLRDGLRKSLKQLEKVGFTRGLSVEPPAWEVLPVLKTRLTVEALQSLRDELHAHPGGKPAVSGEPSPKEPVLKT